MPKFRRVTGLFRAAMPDGPDTDYTPELEALNGQIEFIPRHRGGVIAYPHLEPPEFVRPEPIQAVLQDGYVMTQVSVGEETTIQPVELLVSDDDEATQSWQWEAVFRDIRVGRWGDEIAISPLRFTVPDEPGPLDLTEVVGEKQSGVVTVKGPRGYGITSITASDGVVTVKWEGGSDVEIPIPTAALATPSSDGLMPKADKAKLDGVVVDTSVGTRVMVGGVMVHGTTGWRDVSSLLGPGMSLVDGGAIWVRRDDARVSVHVRGVTATSGSNILITALPTGFFHGSLNTRTMLTEGGVYLNARTNEKDVRLPSPPPSAIGTRWDGYVASWVTTQAWPTTLPGTPA